MQIFLLSYVVGVEKPEIVFHLCVECEIALWCWSHIKSRRGTDVLSKVSSSFSLRELCQVKPLRKSTKVWKIIVATVLWSIWLARNELAFKNKRIERGILQTIIFLHSYKLLEASQLIYGNLSNAWTLAPEGCIRICSIYHRKLYWSKLLLNQITLV